MSDGQATEAPAAARGERDTPAPVVPKSTSRPRTHSYNAAGMAVAVVLLSALVVCVVADIAYVCGPGGIDVLQDEGDATLLMFAWMLLVFGLFAPLCVLQAVLLPPVLIVRFLCTIALLMHALCASVVLSASSGGPVPACYATACFLDIVFAVAMLGGPENKHFAFLLPRTLDPIRRVVRIGPL